MAIQLINIGDVANDGTGDDLREAFVKVNQNFEELDLRDDEQTTARNIGAVGEGVFAQKLGYDLQFKRLVPSTDITLTSTDDTIIMSANGGLKSLLVSTDSGSVILEETDNININGGTGISTSLVGNTITIQNTTSELVTDTTPQLGGNLDAQSFDLLNVGTITASQVNAPLTGNVTGLVHGIDIRDLNVYFEEDNFDFGDLGATITSIAQWVFFDPDVDFGTFLYPDSRVVDLGSIS